MRLRRRVGVAALAVVGVVGALAGCAGPTGGSAGPPTTEPPAPPANLSGAGNFGSLFVEPPHTDAPANWNLPGSGGTYAGVVSGTGADGNPYTYYATFETSGHDITRMRMGTSPTEGVDGEIIETDVAASRVASSPWCAGGTGLLLEGAGPVLINGVDSMGWTWAYDLTICNEAAADWFGA